MSMTIPLRLVSLVLRGDTLDPAEWTTFFNKTPCSWAVKGQRICRVGRTIEGTVSKTGLWVYCPEHREDPKSMDFMVKSMLDELSLPNDIFLKRKKYSSIQCEISMYFDNHSGAVSYTHLTLPTTSRV